MCIPVDAPTAGLWRIVLKADRFWRNHSEQWNLSPAWCRPSRGLVGRIDWPHRGLCAWCRRKTGPRNKWHEDCVRAYSMAKGLTVVTCANTPLIQRQVCASCGVKTGCRLEIDHIMPLGLAGRGGLADWLKAYSLSNLQALCPDCHKAKTANDRALMAQADRVLRAAKIGQGSLF